jgi:putative Flp pilus-assembly TadE/G-like protein
MASSRRCACGSPRGQAGVITGLLVIFAICLLLTVIAVTDLSAAYLRRQGAMSLADGAALAATQAAAAGSIYHGDGGAFVPIDQAAASAAVRRYLTTIGAYGDYPGLQSRVQVFGHRVIVFLSMPYRLPFPVPGVKPTTTVHATSAAELPIYQ